MKNLFAFIFSTMTVAALAQPSSSAVAAKVKSKNPDIVHVDVTKPRTILEGGVNKTYYGITSKIKTSYPGIYRFYWYEARYRGNTHEKDLIGTSWYEGIPDLTDSEMATIENHVKNNLGDVFGSTYDYMTDTRDLEMEFVEHKGNKFFWSNLNAGEVYIKFTYDKFNSTTRELRTIQETKTIHFSKSVDGENWDPKANYLPNGKLIERNINSGVKVQQETELNSRIVPESEEVGLLKEKMYAEMAAAEIAKLPEITVPACESYYDFIYFIHNTLRGGDKDMITAMLYKVASPWFFYNYEAKVLNSNGVKFFEEWSTDAANYSAYFCEYPQVKADQYGLVNFFTRDLTGYNRIQVKQLTDGSWQLIGLEFPSSNERAEQSKAAGDANCGEKLMVKMVRKYNIGDNVVGTIRGKAYAGKIEKKDDMMDDRYFVRFEGTSAQWINGDQLTPASGSASSNNSTKTEEESNKSQETKDKIKGLKNKVKIKIP